MLASPTHSWLTVGGGVKRLLLPRLSVAFITMVSDKSLPLPSARSEISRFKPLGKGIFPLGSHAALPVTDFFWGRWGGKHLF